MRIMRKKKRVRWPRKGTKNLETLG